MAGHRIGIIFSESMCIIGSYQEAAMKYQNSITKLSSIIILLAVVAVSMGIFFTGGPDPYNIETVRGESVTVYGEGLDKHMSKDVAPQGIAQDYVTHFVGVPLGLLGQDILPAIVIIPFSV
jgi:hypothetical protein